MSTREAEFATITAEKILSDTETAQSVEADLKQSDFLVNP